MYNGPWLYLDPIFGWTFYAVLLGFLAVATYTDVGTLKIPKTVTLPMLGVGLVFSMVRGAWMGSLFETSPSAGHAWLFARSPMLGALDGLLFSLAGFLAAFVLFLGLYLVRVKGVRLMRGGDLKLVAALGVWVGPVIVLLVVLLTIPILLILGTFLVLRKLFRRGVQKTVFSVRGRAHGDNLKKASHGKRRADVLLAYSLAVALATGGLLAWVAVHDQQHPVPPKSETPAEQVTTQR